MVSIKISRGKFPRPGPDTSALRMLERLTAVNAGAIWRTCMKYKPTSWYTFTLDFLNLCVLFLDDQYRRSVAARNKTVEFEFFLILHSCEFWQTNFNKEKHAFHVTTVYFKYQHGGRKLR